MIRSLNWKPNFKSGSVLLRTKPEFQSELKQASLIIKMKEIIQIYPMYGLLVDIQRRKSLAFSLLFILHSSSAVFGLAELFSKCFHHHEKNISNSEISSDY